MQDNKPKIELQSIKIKAKINLTADDWQLYGEVPGRNMAARRLNRAVEKKLAKGEIGSLTEVLSPFSTWGAADSEGYHTLYAILKNLGLNDDKFI